jgi:hypothetical protein
MISTDYLQAIQVIGFAVLCAFGFYGLKLVSSFRTGILANSWKYVTVGALFLIFGQIPFLLAGVGSVQDSTLALFGSLMRGVGIIALTLGLRIQCQVWRNENRQMAPRSNPIEI